jgi:hypothetical protein
MTTTKFALLLASIAQMIAALAQLVGAIKTGREQTSSKVLRL